MVLVDTSVWIRHFREGVPALGRLLNEGEVMCHPFIVGELACGNLKNRDEILSFLRLLPEAVTAEYDEVLKFIDENRLMRRGLGYIDMHLSAAALLTGVTMWTYDKRLGQINEGLGIKYEL